LSIQRIFCINGFSIASMRTPQIVPVICAAFGCSFGAFSKNVRRSTRRSICCASERAVWPVSQQITSSSSAFVRCFFATFFT
jgi:hypothetical protein